MGKRGLAARKEREKLKIGLSAGRAGTGGTAPGGGNQNSTISRKKGEDKLKVAPWTSSKKPFTLSRGGKNFLAAEKGGRKHLILPQTATILTREDKGGQEDSRGRGRNAQRDKRGGVWGSS